MPTLPRWLAPTVAALAVAACTHRPTNDELGLAAFQRGYAALQEEDWAKAQRELTDAARYLPKDSFTQLDLGVAEQRLGHMDAARAAYQRAVELGKDVKPRDVGNPLYAARTVAELAQDDLAGMEAPATPPPSGGAAKP